MQQSTKKRPVRVANGRRRGPSPLEQRELMSRISCSPSLPPGSPPRRRSSAAGISLSPALRVRVRVARGRLPQALPICGVRVSGPAQGAVRRRERRLAARSRGSGRLLPALRGGLRRLGGGGGIAEPGGPTARFERTQSPGPRGCRRASTRRSRPPPTSALVPRTFDLARRAAPMTDALVSAWHRRISCQAGYTPCPRARRRWRRRRQRQRQRQVGVGNGRLGLSRTPSEAPDRTIRVIITTMD